MDAKLILKSVIFRMNLTTLPFSAKVIIAIVLTSLGILLIASVFQMSFKLVRPGYLIDQINSFYSNSSMESLIQLRLTGDRKKVPQMDDLYIKIPGKAETNLPYPQIQQGATRISIKVDHYPFFADDFDHNNYE